MSDEFHEDRVVEGFEEGAVPYVGALSDELQALVQDRARGWVDDGVSLDHAIVILEARGQGLPSGMEAAGICTAALGVVGESMETEELLNRLVEIIERTCEAAELRSPLREHEAYKQAVLKLIEDAQEHKEKFEGNGLIQRIRDALPSRKRERALILMMNRYMHLIKQIMETGAIDSPDEEIEGIHDLTPAMFEK